MMVVDTSAIIAMIMGEPEAGAIEDALLSEPTPLISAGTVLELDIVAFRRGGAEMREVMEEIVVASGCLVVPVGGRNLAEARNGYEQFGQGRGVAPAVLNFGDCFAYGLAKAEDAPLLFKGKDFTRTDIKVVPVRA